jgi:UDP-glucuronate decarboxylase
MLMNTPSHVVGPMNLGNPIEFSMKELASLVIRYTESDVNVVYKALPLDDPKQRRPDISYAQEQLGWAPTIFIDEGLQRTIAYFKQEN